MDGLELRQTLMRSLALGMETVAEERKTANGNYHAELVGRTDAMRNILEFLVNAQIGPCANCPKDSDVKEPGLPVDGGSEAEGEAQ